MFFGELLKPRLLVNTIKFKIFEGKYPYYVIVEPIGEIKKIEKASKIFKKLGISWRDILTEEGAKLISHIIEKNTYDININRRIKIVDEDYRPPIFSTTLWDYPKQSYGDTPKGNNKYPGVTPAFIIYNLIHRYTSARRSCLRPYGRLWNNH
jgi:hypothetical protein